MPIAVNNKILRKERIRIARGKGSHTKKEWESMKLFFNVCVMCLGKSRLINLEKDHIIPLYQGGSDSIKNIQPVCAKCNASKGPNDTDYRIKACEALAIKMPEEWCQHGS